MDTKAYEQREAARKLRNGAEWQAAFKERRREAGFKRIEVWVHPDDQAEVKKLVARLQAKRGLE